MELSTLLRKVINKYRREGLRSVAVATSEYVKKIFFRYYVFKFLTALRYRKQRYLYDIPADPYKLIYVDTDDINYFNETINPHWGLGVIRGGEWDRPDNCTPIHATTHYKGLKQRFEEGVEWEDTTYYRERIRGSDRKEDRLDYFDKLFKDIKERGYRPNFESGHDAPEGGRRQGRSRHVHALEPIVTIGREGDLYLNEGFHRLAIVKLLDIEQIPVNVLARHKQWQEIRDEIYNTRDMDGKPELKKYISHPDLGDVVSEKT